METKDKTNKILLGSEMYEECIQLNQNLAYSPSRVRSKKQDLSAADQESSPLSHYEVVKGVQNQKKVDTTRNPSPEYAEIVSKDKHQAAEMEEQHYYHSTDVHYYSSVAEIVCTDEPNSCS